MTTGTMPTSSCPSVFDVGLPSLDYLQMQDPEDAHRAIADACRQAPIALGVRRCVAVRRRSPRHHRRAAVASDHQFDSVH
jgi:hypothetical protein